MLSRQEQNMFKKADDYFIYKEIQLLKSEMFKKTNHINALTVLNVHIFSNEKEKSDNKQEEVVISELSDTDSHEEQSLEKLWKQEKERDEIYKKLV